MAYQNVGRPRFFIDHGLWLSSLGVYTPEDRGGFDAQTILELIQLDPTKTHSMPTYATSVIVPRYAPINYVAVLGHSLTEGSPNEITAAIYSYDDEGGLGSGDVDDLVNVINMPKGVPS